MTEHSQRATWPFLCMLFCLFILSVTAPRSWERVARTVPIRLEPDPHAPLASAKGEPVAGKQHTAAAVDLVVEKESVSGRNRNQTRKAVKPGAASPRAGQQPERADDIARLPVEEARPSGAIADLHEPSPANRVDDHLLAPQPGRTETANDGTRSSSNAATSRSAPDNAISLEPSALLSLLEALAEQDGCSGWANDTSRIVTGWTHQPSLDSERGQELIDELRRSLRAADALLEELAADSSTTWLRRARYALARRLALWQRAVEMLSPDVATQPVAPPNPAQLATCLASVDELMRSAPGGAAWREYLLIELLEDLTSARGTEPEAEARMIAQEVLRRLESPRLTAAQQEFMAEGPIAELAAELRNWAVEQVEIHRLATRLEKYEQSRRPSAARVVAGDIEHLHWSASEADQDLGRELETHYRNCNLRIAVHRDLLNRLLPEQPDRDDEVRQNVLGMSVRGRRTTTTNLAIRLTPNKRRLRFTLEAQGRVESSTSVHSGPATLYNDTDSRFLVEKPMEIDLGGIYSTGARVRADSSNRLRSLRTDFDGVPLLGSLVRAEVMRQHDERRGEARRAIERMVAMTALDLFEQDVNARVEKANELIDRRVLVPLGRLSLVPTATVFETTKDRLIVRARLATPNQLGAYTPRPLAPADSLLSIQMHESALNNTIEQLEVAGKTFSAAELQQWIGHKLNLDDVLAGKPPRDDVWLAFAVEDPVTIRFQQGRAEVRLAFDWLQKGRRRWRDFEVRVAYRPDPKSDSGELVRDGTIQLIADGLGARGQFALRSVFSKLFSAQRRFRVVPERISSDPRLADLSVTQFEVDDGWIGLALAARDVGDGHRTARGLEPTTDRQTGRVGAKSDRRSIEPRAARERERDRR